MGISREEEIIEPVGECFEEVLSVLTNPVTKEEPARKAQEPREDPNSEKSPKS